MKPLLSLWVSVWFYAWLWRLSARLHLERAWKHVCSLSGVMHCCLKKERATSSARDKAQSLITLHAGAGLICHMSQESTLFYLYLNQIIHHVQLLLFTNYHASPHVLVSQWLCVSVCVPVSARVVWSSYVQQSHWLRTLSDVQTLRRWWVFSGHILAACIDSV